MKLEDFKKEFVKVNSFKFGDIILFNDFEVYNIKTEESIQFSNLDDACEHLKSEIEKLEEFTFKLGGGSGNRSNAKSLFGADGGVIDFDNSTKDLPAKMNKLYNGNEMSQTHTLDTFREQHASAKTESAIIMDDNGFVGIYKHGNANSVGWSVDELTGGNLIHNHPNGSNFSKADLDTWSSTGIKSITATSTKSNYTVAKTSKFDAKGFTKGLNQAKTVQTDYNKAVDLWLKSNQGKYGYTYSAKKY